MRSSSLRNLFLKNAFANVLGGAGTALFNILLPALAVRHLDKLEFSVWTLALQVSIYVQLFGMGLQTVVTYRIAKSGAQSDLQGQRDSLAAGIALSKYFSIAAALVVILLVSFYPILFSGVPENLVGKFRLCVALFGSSALFQLLALVPIGGFMGLQRNIVPVFAQLGVRCLSLVLAVVALFQGANLIVLSVLVALSSAMIMPAMWSMSKWKASELFSALATPKPQQVRSMWTECAGLAIWNVAMLLVNGIDTVVVGYFAFDKVASYSLAVTAVTILVGVLQAALNPLVAMGSMLSTDIQYTRLRRLLIISSRCCSAFLVIVTLALMIAGKNLLPYWVGLKYVDEVYVFLIVLLIANGVRNLMGPYAVLLVSVGMQRKALLPAVAEGLVNLFSSVYLAGKFGALGVAYGTLLGALAGVFFSTLLVVNKTHQLVESRMLFMRQVLIIPLCALGCLFFYSFK